MQPGFTELIEVIVASHDSHENPRGDYDSADILKKKKA